MKMQELFEKAEKFFGMDKDERIQNIEKKEKLMSSLEEKISSMKENIKNCDEEEKKEVLKKEIEVLQKLKDKILSDEYG